MGIHRSAMPLASSHRRRREEYVLATRPIPSTFLHICHSPRKLDRDHRILFHGDDSRRQSVILWFLPTSLCIQPSTSFAVLGSLFPFIIIDRISTGLTTPTPLPHLLSWFFHTVLSPCNAHIPPVLHLYRAGVEHDSH